MNTDSASHDAQTGGTNVPPDARPSGTTERVSDERLAEILAWYVNWQPCAEDPGLSRMEADAISLFRELQRLRSSGGACDSPLAAGDAFVAAFKREPKDPADLAWMNGYAAGRRAPEPGGQPPQFYRLQDVYDRFHFVDYDARMWELIVVPQPLTKAG